MGKNRHAISLRDGTVSVNGTVIMEACKFKLVFKPEVGSYKSLNEKGTNRRWIGRDITGSIEEYRSTSWLLDVAKEYEENGTTPELTIQGVRDDKDSDYYGNVGAEVVTAEGCVLDGEITLLELDASGDFVKDSIGFGAKDAQF